MHADGVRHLLRFLFEKSVIEQNRRASLFPDKLCELMTAAQKKLYGDGGPSPVRGGSTPTCG